VSHAVGGHEGLRLLARVLLSVVAGVAVYGGAARLLGVAELRALVRSRRATA